jgi:formylglycine-generating enzyme required for sulfatase activity
MVRDDFWMAATRFMRDLEVRLLEGENSAAVDLFAIRHAEKVLAAFGRAFGVLPENPSETSKDQKQFLEQAVAGLAQEGKVICVRLALFAEMMKGKAWTPSSLKAVGGTEGVGVTFLEETFSAATAPPEHRYHQKAARADLKILLPETGSDIKGHMRSYAELLEASGYGSRPKDFDDLIRILDNEIRLITPTDPEGKDANSDSVLQTRPGQKYYQLTHDYLVRSIREWLTRKQKETTRGRTELLLADRAEVWNARPDRRQLPTLPQFGRIRLLTKRRNWTDPQRKMMRQAARHHAVRGLIGLLILTSVGWAGYEGFANLKAHALRDRLLDANTPDVPNIVGAMAPYRRWADPLLWDTYQAAEASQDRRRQLNTSLALLPVDPDQKEYLYARLLEAEPHDIPVLRDALAPYRQELVPRLWRVLEQEQPKGQTVQRLRAACALALYDPDNPLWEKCAGQVVDDLVRVPAVHLVAWMDPLRPVRDKLQAPLAAIYRGANGKETERSMATDILSDYAAEQPQVLADLVMDGDDKQFAVLFPKLKNSAERARALAQAELDKRLPASGKEDAKEKLAQRQANAAVVLLRLDPSANVWPMLRHRPDPRVRTYLIHRLAPMGVDAKAIVRRLEEEPDATVQRALILSLGEFGEDEWSPAERGQLVEKLREIYCTSADPGLHGAAEWLLRHAKQQAWLKQAEAAWLGIKEKENKRLEQIKRELSMDKGKVSVQWYVNGQGQTMVVIPGPAEFMMGSPPTELGRGDRERRHRRRIGRTLAIAAKPVTVEEFLKFREGFDYIKPHSPTENCPMNSTTWYDAAAYCNWLSQQEGIDKDQWCYEPNPDGQYAEGMKLKSNYLSLMGYRLPTEAEMEYACRAGALTSRYYGESEGMLEKYAWFRDNSRDHSWPVGSLKPNDLGLFDMHGNVMIWCQEKFKPYPASQSGEAADDTEDTLVVTNLDNRAYRSGCFTYQAVDVRSATRNWATPMNTFSNMGIRPARTFR